MDRRQWLKSAGLLALGAGCGRAPSNGVAPVNVSTERVTRTTVGLRPFRPSGFRVEAERFDNKTVVHNYGHGGGGMSLSWGSSHLAVDKALATGQDRYAVIGCGVMGLSTGRLLQKLGKSVTIYTKQMPPDTTSNMSAAWWSPGSTVDPSERTEAYDEQFVKAYAWDGVELKHEFTVDFYAKKLGRPHIMRFGANALYGKQGGKAASR